MTDQFWAVSLALEDAGFLEKWRPHLKDSDFPRGPLQFITTASLLHWDKFHVPLDTVTFLGYTELIDDPDERNEVIQTYGDLAHAYTITDSSRPFAWEQAEQWIQNRHLGTALDDARAALSVGDRETAFDKLLNLEGVTGRVREEPLALDSGNLSVLLSARPDSSQAIPTGIPELDRMWGGGLYPSNFAIVLSGTNTGKSMLLSYFAAYAYAANKRILFFTYELTRLQILERVLATLFQTPPKYIGVEADTQILALREGLGLDRAALTIDDGIETVADLRRRLNTGDYDVVFLDSADDMRPREKYQNTYGSQGEIYSDLLHLCQGERRTIWTSTQATREAMEKATFGLRQMGDSFIKARRAQLVLGLSQTEEDLNEVTGTKMKFMVLKDTLHGSRGWWARYTTKFPKPKAEGYPSFQLAELKSMV